MRELFLLRAPLCVFFFQLANAEVQSDVFRRNLLALRFELRDSLFQPVALLRYRRPIGFELLDELGQALIFCALPLALAGDAVVDGYEYR